MSSYCNRQIMDLGEIRGDTIEKLPSGFQIGDEVSYWIQTSNQEVCDESTLVEIEAIVIGVKITSRHAIWYDIAVPIKGTELYATINNTRGWLTRRGETTDPNDGGLFSLNKLNKHIEKNDHILESKRDTDDDGYHTF